VTTPSFEKILRKGGAFSPLPAVFCSLEESVLVHLKTGDLSLEEIHRSIDWDRRPQEVEVDSGRGL
jgi:hypothetical protein